MRERARARGRPTEVRASYPSGLDLSTALAHLISVLLLLHIIMMAAHAKTEDMTCPCWREGGGEEDTQGKEGGGEGEGEFQACELLAACRGLKELSSSPPSLSLALFLYLERARARLPRSDGSGSESRSLFSWATKITRRRRRRRRPRLFCRSRGSSIYGILEV